MAPDPFQQAWHAQSSQTRVTVDTDLLRNEVQRSQRSFRTIIFFRDFREVAVGLLLIPIWFYMGHKLSLPWTWYLEVPALIFIVGYILVDRWRHPQRLVDSGAPMLESVKESLAQVEHQIWLLRNVLWWYILPGAIATLPFFAQVLWNTLGDAGLVFVMLFGGCLLAIVFSGYCFVYYINQRAVRTQLEPRRQELLALIASLNDETTSEASGEYPILMSAESNCCSPRRMLLASLCVVAILVLVGPAILYFAGSTSRWDWFGPDHGYLKRSPFAAVRWRESQPEVQISGEWYRLISLNDIPADDIVAFSQTTFADKWQKRFEEDLVELLTGMGHPPQDKVTLVVQSLTSPETQTLNDVPMTEANRRSIRNAAQARELSVPSPANGATAPAAVPLAELTTKLRKERGLVGLAALVEVDGQVVASAVDGERKSGSGVPLEIGDRWHLGSITKSITATMIARLVEAGKMKWSDTVADAFPNAPIDDDWKPVTLRQLLTHTAGAPENFSTWVMLKKPALGPACTEARRDAVLGILATKPEHPPGTKFSYSNVGYTIAGAMAEQATGESWDNLVKREVFEPLGLTNAGFGPPKSSDDKLEQPRGHTSLLGVKVPVGDDADNTFIMGPAGIVHMSLADLSAYATEHLRGDRGAGKLLSADTYKLLHTPELNSYACGWSRVEPSAAIPHVVYSHNGSNTMWYALVAFIPDKDMVVAVTSNDGDFATAEVAAWEIVMNSVRQAYAGRSKVPAGDTN